MSDEFHIVLMCVLTLNILPTICLLSLGAFSWAMTMALLAVVASGTVIGISLGAAHLAALASTSWDNLPLAIQTMTALLLEAALLSVLAFRGRAFAARPLKTIVRFHDALHGAGKIYQSASASRCLD